MSSGPRGRQTGMSTQAHPLAPADRDAFATLAERHRHELQRHCYRMLASFDEAQDTLDLALPLMEEAAGGPVEERLRRAHLGRDGHGVLAVTPDRAGARAAPPPQLEPTGGGRRCRCGRDCGWD